VIGSKNPLVNRAWVVHCSVMTTFSAAPGVVANFSSSST
jgi:hypothetical protein